MNNRFDLDWNVKHFDRVLGMKKGVFPIGKHLL